MWITFGDVLHNESVIISFILQQCRKIPPGQTRREYNIDRFSFLCKMTALWPASEFFIKLISISPNQRTAPRLSHKLCRNNMIVIPWDTSKGKQQGNPKDSVIFILESYVYTNSKTARTIRFELRHSLTHPAIIKFFSKLL
jgi:hypothetical protein